MLHTIENDQLICTIDSLGAEVRSLKNKSLNKEYIWPINSSLWNSSSPILFPSIGNIKEGKISYKGQDYAMTKHGIIRNNENLSFKQISNSKCSFSLESCEDTKKKYPFDFRFTVIYELVNNRLVMTYEVENKDQDMLFFSCGGHTAYLCSLDELTKLSDYVIEFPNQVQLKTETLGNSGLLSYNRRSILLENNMLELTNSIFNDDALVFANIDFDWVRLRKKNESKGVIIRFSGYPNLALWSKPRADYVCIEPWLGLPDREDESVEISKKATYHKLEHSEEFSISIETEIE